MIRRLRPARIEHVVDGVKLRAQLSAAALEHIGDDAAARKRALNLLHGALFRGRMIAQERLEAGENGLAVARLLAKVADEAVSALFDFVTTHVFRSRNPTEGERFAVIAVGGYGRGELAPSSDIDLLFLRAYKQTAWTESVTEYMLYMLWDMGLKVGHSSRTVEECLKLSKEDHTIQTALLEARRICGDKSLFEDLRTRFRADITPQAHAAFVAAKLKERDERHARAGASRYMVEPNIKEGKGGLRDLHTLFWLVRHQYGFEKPHDYLEHGVFSREELHAFTRAAQFLWTVRCHLHFLTGRGEERLSFDLQPEMAARLGYGRRGEQQGVERFMKRYFLVAREVGALTRVICAKLEADQAKRAPVGLARLFPVGRKPVETLTRGFRIESGRLDVEDKKVLDDPVNILRLFEIAENRDLDVQPAVLREVSARLKRVSRSTRRDPEAIAAFLSVATSPNNPAGGLRLMNEVGVLGRFLPEFGRIVAQMQFNMYHHYTVDEHTLRAIEYISEIENGRRREEHPLATEIFPKIINRRALYMAMLLHDTGKGDGDQQIEGEKSARAACERLGLPHEEVDLVGWLVRHHLEMSDVAQRRDIGDPATVAQFAQLVGNLERLRLLLVLTVADIRAVGPGVWNGWKGQLLRDLYRLTVAALSGGVTGEDGMRERLANRAEEVKGALVEALPAPMAARLEGWFASLDDAYWLSFDADALAWHAQEVDAASKSTDQPHVAARPRADRGVTEILVTGPDRKGLFASLTAALAAGGADVMDARVNTTTKGAVIDVFGVQTIDGRPFGIDSPSALNRLLAGLERAVVKDAPPVSAAAPARRAAAFAIAPWVRIDNDLTPRATVVEVSGRDRPGLLSELAATIAAADLSIESAHIGSVGERAADVFYVRAQGGGQIADVIALEALERGLEAVLKKGEPEAPADPARRKLAVAFASEAR
ncbi:MAG: [protein-PII] uridylyltransferase [Alphaproteobacteria bacterium]|nr:[protein-PII] uridylyltransferase [Alphaproteobacteria bacterium]